jgi:hypothetical protein
MVKEKTAMNRRRLNLTTAILLLVPASALVLWFGCVPVTDGGGVHEEEALSANVHTTSAELKTLEEVTFEVEILDEMGHHMMDMAAVSLEVRAVGGEWREIELIPMGDHYVGLRTFSSSGDYEIRVSGMTHAGHAMEEMHMMTIHMDRAHVDAGPFHVEYESDPGHVHGGDEAMLMFWVALADGGAAATGMSPLIVVEESDGHLTELDAEEVEAGVYQAPMQFADSGETHVSIVLVDETGAEFEADFHFHVSAPH